tara:strand:- start:1375 stop:2025 length:651 start_codon:yes stop_codon:yes gene_type:complete
MALLGQASGGFTESSSALRILHVGIRNTVGVLTADAFTQSNPPTTATGTSDQIDPSILGVLSGSVAFSRGDATEGGPNEVGGPLSGQGGQPLGCFINSANGNSFENTPGAASGKGPYVSAQGCYANATFETEELGGGGEITYTTGDNLVASVNGYLTSTQGVAAIGGADINNNSHCAAEVAAGNLALLNGDTDVLIGVLKMPSDATQDEIVYDQRI